MRDALGYGHPRLLRNVITAFGIACLFFIICVPASILIFQAAMYLHTGVWPSVSVLDTIRYFRSLLPHSLIAWAFDPQSWVGLHKMSGDLHIGIPSFGVGLLLFWLRGEFAMDPVQDELA